MDFHVLGPLEAFASGVRVGLGRRQERRLLGFLLLEAGRPVTAERLIQLLWDDTVPSSARAALHTHAARLRAWLAGYAVRLESRNGTYRLNVPSECVDAFRFTKLVALAGTLREPASQAAQLSEALALWRGPLLSGDLSDDVRDRVGSHLHNLRLQAVEQKAAADLASGRHGQVVMELSAVLRQHQTREHLAGLLMLALYRCGRQSEALDIYRHTRQHLVDVLGIEPAAELRHLHEQILRNQVAPLDIGLPSKPDATAVPRQLPLATHGFTGRHRDIELLDLLTANSVVIVSGMGGVGKTALAVHWGHRVVEHFPDGQLYLDLRGFDPSGLPITPADALRRFLEALGQPAGRVPVEVDAQAALYRTLLADRKVLVLLDNAHDADQVRPLLPGGSGCRVVITSRDRLAGLAAAEGATVLPLTPLPTADAHQLLAARLPDPRPDAEPHAAQQIIESCGHLPLALTIVAAQAAAQPQATLEQIAASLRQAGNLLDVFDVGDATTDVRRVFSWSLRCLSAAARRLFGLMAVHPGPNAAIPAIASLAGQAPEVIRDPLNELIRQHLIVPHEAGRYGFHDLVRFYALEVAEFNPDRDAAIGRVLSHYLHSANAATMHLTPTRDPLPLPDAETGITTARIGDKQQAAAWFLAEYQSMLSAIRYCASHGLSTLALGLSWSLENYFDSRSLWRDWYDIDTIALNAAREANDSLGQAIAHRGLARASSRLNHYSEAEQHCLRAEHFFASLNDLAGLAHTHVAHGFVAERLGRLGETLQHTETALTLFRAAKHVAGEARALNNLGWHHALHGDFGPALKYCQEAVALQQKTGNRMSEAIAWDSIGYIHLKRGAFDHALDCYQRALALHHEDGNRSDEAETWENISEVHLASLDTSGAIEALRNAMTILHDVNPAEANRIGAKMRELM